MLSTVTAGQPVLLNSTVGNTSIIEAASHLVLTAEASEVTEVGPQVDTETYVRAYFAKTPVLAEIAYCESKFVHVTKEGKILRGKLTPDDVGVMQINEYFHGKTAEKLGLNLETLEGNLKYAEYLYNKNGTQPWSASKHCWNK